MVVKCPYCHIELESEEDVTGLKVQCPECEKKFVVGASSDKRGPAKSAGFRKAVRWLLPMAVGLIAGICVSLLFRSTADSASSSVDDAGGKECYKLKYSAVVEKLGKDGSAGTETLNLNAGTILALMGDSPQPRTDTRLKPSGMSCEEFLATKPKDAVVFEARIKLDDYFIYIPDDLRDELWSIAVYLPASKCTLHGFVIKANTIAKDVFEAVRSGASINCMVKVEYMPTKIRNSRHVLITDFCPL